LATEGISYLTYAEAVYLHIKLMRLLGETQYGVFDRALIESALARPRHAVAYEGADLIRQAATLCYGLIRNHPWVGGNKRTATALIDEFLFRNGVEISASILEILELVLAVEADRWGVDDIDAWLRKHVRPGKSPTMG
jgi:death on curing protein